jgi:transcriptional regulator with XRE-family HTH domain
MASEVPPQHSLGELLRSYRIAAGLTQEELAARSGLSVRTLSDIERDRTARPYWNSVERIAEVLRLCGATRQHFFDTARGHSATLAIVPDIRQSADWAADRGGQAGYPGPPTAGTTGPQAALTQLVSRVRS